MDLVPAAAVALRAKHGILLEKIKSLVEVDGGTKEDIVQKAWFAFDWENMLRGHILTSFLYDSHGKPLPNRRKPDCVHILKEYSPCEMAVVACGDLKGKREASGFSPDQKGRILDFCRVISSCERDLWICL